MKPEFSFNYDEKRCVFFVENNAIYELESGITVRVERNLYEEYDAVDWVLYFENKSKSNSRIFSDILDCDTLFELNLPEPPKSCDRMTEGDACVITMNGAVKGLNYWENDAVSATEYQLNYEYLDKVKGKTKRFSNIGGRSSEGTMPFFDVTALNNGYIAAVGWTGDWKSEFTKCERGIHMKTGMKETRFYLKPGEKLRTTSVLIMKYDKSEDKYNKFRRLIKKYFSHKSSTETERDGLMACELWGGLPSEEMKNRINTFKKYGIKFEDIWIDAGWYGNCTDCIDSTCGDWSKHTGDWEVNLRVHPEGLTDVAKCAEEAGAKIMLWLEPERARQGTKISEQHPEWFLRMPNCKDEILYYGNEKARSYISELLSHYVEELDMSCYRQDFNVQLTGYFEENDEENRRGITEIKHITGMYQIWDELLAKYPKLIIDNCSSGGNRIDIETLKRSIPFFRSDYQCNFRENPEVLQVHNSNASLYLPYNGCTSKTKGDTYAIRSSYSSSWGGAFYNAIFQCMDENDLIWAKKITDEYRRIRKYMSMDFYNLGSNKFDDTSWTIWQYHDGDTQSGIVIAFRRERSPFARANVELKGLRDNQFYMLTNLDDGTERLFDNSVEIVLPERRSSVIFEYKPK